MKHNISLVFAGDHSPVDVLDAIGFKSDSWKEERAFLSSIFSDSQMNDASIFLNSYMSSEFSRDVTKGYTQKQLLRELGIKMNVLEGYSQHQERKALDENGFFPNSVPLRLLTFDLPDTFLGKIFKRSSLKLMRLSMEGVMNRSTSPLISNLPLQKIFSHEGLLEPEFEYLIENELSKMVEAREKFLILDSRSHSIAYFQGSFLALKGEDLASSSLFCSDGNLLSLPVDVRRKLWKTLQRIFPSEKFTTVSYNPTLLSLNDSQKFPS